MAKTDLKTASVLAFERKLDPSDALFAGGNWACRDTSETWPAIGVREKSVRGTISNRLAAKEQDPAKLDASIQSPNLQTVDVATLPHQADTLRVAFTLRVLGGAGSPAACNNTDYQSALAAVVSSYQQDTGFGELARRYAINLANGRFLWRNRVGAEQIEIRIRHRDKDGIASEWCFDALAFNLRDFADLPANAAPALQALSAAIEAGLSGQKHTLLEIVAYARMGHGQEVYPSQELILERGNERNKSKTLYTVGDIAGMHSQKIGNALRTIDTWYPATPETFIGPIAVEPYGSVTSQGKAYRQPQQKMDFYTLLDNWVLKGNAPSQENCHFVMATLIRGGVFGEAEKKKKEA